MDIYSRRSEEKSQEKIRSSEFSVSSPKLRRFSCRFCTGSFEIRRDLVRHSLHMHKQPDHTRSELGNSFSVTDMLPPPLGQIKPEPVNRPTKEQLVIPLQRIDQNDSFQESRLGEESREIISSTESSVTIPKTRNSNSNGYSCKFCPKSFSKQGALNLHSLTHRKQSKLGTSAISVTDTLPQGEQAIPKLVDRPTKEQLVIPLQRIDQNDSFQEFSRAEESPEIIWLPDDSSVTIPKMKELKRYSCKHCTRTFEKPNSLQIHSVNIHQERLEKSELGASVISITDTMPQQRPSTPSIDNQPRKEQLVTPLERVENRSFQEFRFEEVSQEITDTISVPHKISPLLDHTKSSVKPVDGSTNEYIVIHLQRIPENYLSQLRLKLKASQTELATASQFEQEAADAESPKNDTHTCKPCARSFKTASGLYLHTVGRSHKLQSLTEYENIEAEGKSITAQSHSEQVEPRDTDTGLNLKQAIVCLPRVSEDFIVARSRSRSRSMASNPNANSEEDTTSPCFGESPYKLRSESFRTQHCFPHTKKRKFQCSKCNESFPSPIGISNHMRAHAKRDVQCPKCELSFSNARKLESHLEAHHGRQAQNSASRKLESHLEAHHGKINKKNSTAQVPAKPTQIPMPTGCLFCGKKFQFPAFLERHMMTHTKEKPYQCKLCKAAFSWKNMYDSHSKTHTNNDIHCTQCELRFPNRKTMEAHAEEHRIELNEPLSSSPNESTTVFQSTEAVQHHPETLKLQRKLQCPKCSKKFQFRHNLFFHMRKHANRTKKSITNSEIFSNSTNSNNQNRIQPEVSFIRVLPPNSVLVRNVTNSNNQAGIQPRGPVIQVLPSNSVPFQNVTVSSNHDEIQPEVPVNHVHPSNSDQVQNFTNSNNQDEIQPEAPVSNVLSSNSGPVQNVTNSNNHDGIQPEVTVIHVLRSNSGPVQYVAESDNHDGAQSEVPVNHALPANSDPIQNVGNSNNHDGIQPEVPVNHLLPSNSDLVQNVAELNIQDGIEPEVRVIQVFPSNSDPVQKVPDSNTHDGILPEVPVIHVLPSNYGPVQKVPDSNTHDGMQPGVPVIRNCEVCGKVFKNNYNLRRHLRSVHPDETRLLFRCPNCHEGFSTKDSQSHHTKSSCLIIKIKVFSCKHCDERFTELVSLANHVRTQHKRKMYLCTQCNRRVPFSQISQHMRAHKAKLARREAQTLKRKIRGSKLCPTQTLKTRKDVQFDKDGGESESIATSKRRMSPRLAHTKENHTEHQIIQISQPILTQEDLIVPPKPSQIDGNTVSRVKRPFSCPLCPRIFQARQHLIYHIGTHDRAKNKCQDCDITFSRNNDLMRHQAEVHLNLPLPEAGSNKCKVCNKSFVSAYLFKHVLTHAAKPIYTCQHCSRTFQRIGHLKQHLKSHARLQSFRCSICHIEFPSQHYLRTHKRKEHEPKPIQKKTEGTEDMCILCHKPFRCTETLEHDYDSQMKEVEYKCVENGCKSAFLTEYQLRTVRLIKANSRRLQSAVLEDHSSTDELLENYIRDVLSEGRRQHDVSTDQRIVLIDVAERTDHPTE